MRRHHNRELEGTKREEGLGRSCDGDWEEEVRNIKREETGFADRRRNGNDSKKSGQTTTFWGV